MIFLSESEIDFMNETIVDSDSSLPVDPATERAQLEGPHSIPTHYIILVAVISTILVSLLAYFIYKIANKYKTSQPPSSLPSDEEIGHKPSAPPTCPSSTYPHFTASPSRPASFSSIYSIKFDEEITPIAPSLPSPFLRKQSSIKRLRNSDQVILFDEFDAESAVIDLYDAYGDGSDLDDRDLGLSDVVEEVSERPLIDACLAGYAGSSSSSSLYSNEEELASTQIKAVELRSLEEITREGTKGDSKKDVEMGEWGRSGSICGRQ
jgi:hypothetical protein